MDLEGNVEAIHVSFRQDNIGITTDCRDDTATGHCGYMVPDFKPQLAAVSTRDKLTIVRVLEDWTRSIISGDQVAKGPRVYLSKKL